MAPPRIPIAERLSRNVREDGGCWIWTGCKTKDGYGVLGIGRGKQYRVHRVSYQNAYGPIPEGMLVCHRCDTPLCIRPEHLFLGTPADNTQDMIKKWRRPSRIDAAHHSIKIRHADRPKIREARAAGASLKEIADAYGVSFGTISAICLGRQSYGPR